MTNIPENDSIVDWLSWFQSRDSVDLINKQNQESLFTTFDIAVSNSNCIDEIISHNETVFLQKTNFGEGRISLFHHLTTVGGTIYDAESKSYGFIQGVGRTTATALTPDIDVLSDIESANPVQVPTTTHLFAVSSKDQVENLVESDRISYSPRNFIPVPPFLLSQVHMSISKTGGDAVDALLNCVKSIKEFDINHANDQDYKDKAKSKCKDIIFWLYLVATNSESIKAIPTMSCTNDKVASELGKVVETNLTPKSSAATSNKDSILDHVEKSLKRPFEVLAASSSSTSDFMEKLTQLQSQNNEKTSKSFKKIPTKYQNMILIASSSSGVTSLNYDAEGAEFFKCSNILNAQVMLNSIFEAEGIDCSASSAFTSTLLFGSFLWKDSISPSGFAASVLSSEDFLRSDTLHEGMVLDYSTKFDMSETSLSKLTKSQVLFPSDVEDLAHRMRGIHALSSFFFKPTGFLTQGLKKLVNFCLDNKMLLKTRVFMDSRFIAKFICAVDERMYLWLKSCSTNNSVLSTNYELVEFSSLINDIQLNRFMYILPPSVSKLVKVEDDCDKPSIKKTKKTEMMRNPNIFEEWKLRHNESWMTVFREKTMQGPDLSLACKPCLKYQVKGVCYDDCRQKKSHCVLIGDDKRATNDFIKQLRGE